MVYVVRRNSVTHEDTLVSFDSSSDKSSDEDENLEVTSGAAGAEAILVGGVNDYAKCNAMKVTVSARHDTRRRFGNQSPNTWQKPHATLEMQKEKNGSAMNSDQKVNAVYSWLKEHRRTSKNFRSNYVQAYCTLQSAIAARDLLERYAHDVKLAGFTPPYETQNESVSNSGTQPHLEKRRRHFLSRLSTPARSKYQKNDTLRLLAQTRSQNIITLQDQSREGPGKDVSSMSGHSKTLQLSTMPYSSTHFHRKSQPDSLLEQVQNPSIDVATNGRGSRISSPKKSLSNSNNVSLIRKALKDCHRLFHTVQEYRSKCSDESALHDLSENADGHFLSADSGTDGFTLVSKHPNENCKSIVYYLNIEGDRVFLYTSDGRPYYKLSPTELKRPDILEGLLLGGLTRKEWDTLIFSKEEQLISLLRGYHLDCSKSGVR